MAFMSVVLYFFFFFFVLCPAAEAATVPTVYVFGDSLADVGNNDHLALSILKANFPHNGVDYPGAKATGRFSNGKNFADCLAEMLGVSSPPPYLSIPNNSNKTQVFLQGINFASGGAGVLDTTNSGQCLTLSKQIGYFSTVYADLVQQLGNEQANDHISKSIFALVIGSNDIFHYLKLSLLENVLKVTPEDFVDSMIIKLGQQLKSLYSLGARRFAFAGTGPVGCCPSQRDKSGSCNANANSMSLLYNAGVAPLLQAMKSENSDMTYSFFNTSLTFSAMLENPITYGFTEVKAACCGLGNRNGKFACLPISSLCSDRSKYAFWDFFHPSERTTKMITTTFFQGSSPDVYPINLKELSTL